MKTPIVFREWKCLLDIKKYSNNGRVCLKLVDQQDGMPVCTATTNVPELPLEDGYVFIKNHSENEGILECLYRHKVLDNMKMVQYGNVLIYKCKLLI